MKHKAETTSNETTVQNCRDTTGGNIPSKRGAYPKKSVHMAHKSQAVDRHGTRKRQAKP